MTDHPISTTYLDVQVARADAVLPGAGAYDAAPVELYCPGFNTVAFFIEYTRGAAGGKVGIKPQLSPDGVAWHQASLYNQGVNVAGADTKSTEQREWVEYSATAAAKELFMLTIYLNGTVEKIRIPCAETGVVGSPGTVKITAKFSMANG